MFYTKTLLAFLLAVGLATSALAQVGPGNGANPPAPPYNGQPTKQIPGFPPGFDPGAFDDEGEGANPYADPFGAPGTSANTAQFGGYPGEDGAGNPPPPEQEPVPQNPVRGIYEGGKIVVVVGSPRHFGYRIGDVAPIVILVLADDSVNVSFETLRKGVIAFDGSDFELVEPATIKLLQKKDGKTLWRIDLKVRSFVVKRGIAFNADFQYAIDMAADGRTPNWKKLTTPDFVVSTSNTADNGENLLEGDLEQARPKISWFTYPLLLIGLTLVLFWPALIFMRWYRRVRPPRVVPANEQAWLVFRNVRKEAASSGWTVKHYKQIASALRRYLGVEPASAEEVAVRLKDHPELATILAVLTKCERVLYQTKEPLTEVENAELFGQLEKLVPKP